MKNFFSLLFVLFVSFAGAQNSFAQQSPSGAAGDPTHVAIDGPVMVQLSTDANRPRRVVVISNGPSVRREAGARASADAELERKLAELRQQSDAKNATNESRFSSLETQIRILESKGVNPNDPVIIAIRDEMSRIKSSDQSDKDWRWIYGFLIAIAIMLAILALVLRGGSTVTQTVTINGKGKGKGAKVVNSTGTPTLSAKTPKSEQASDVPAPGSQDKVGDRPPPPGSVRTATKDKVPAGSVNTELGKEVYDLRQRMSGMDSRLNGVEKKVAKVEESMNSQFSQVMAELKKINTTPATPRTVPPAPKQDRNAVDPTFHIARMSHKEGPTSGGQIVKISGPGMEKAEKVNFSGTTMFLAEILSKGSDQVVVKTPAHNADTVSVCVQDADGNRAWAPKAYTFVDPPTPSNEPANPPEDGVTVPFVPKTNESNEPFNNGLASALADAKIAVETPKAEEPAATTNEKVAE